MSSLLPRIPLRGARLFSTSVAVRSAPSARQFDAKELDAALAHLESEGYDPSSIWEQRVVWGEHDQFQHVNNVNYVRWFESARMFFVEKMIAGNPEAFTEKRKDEFLLGTGKSMILANISVRYRRPVTYPDTVLIGQACKLPIGKDRFTLRVVAYSLKQKTIVAISDQDCVTYDYATLKKCDVPQDGKTALESKGIRLPEK